MQEELGGGRGEWTWQWWRQHQSVQEVLSTVATPFQRRLKPSFQRPVLLPPYFCLPFYTPHPQPLGDQIAHSFPCLKHSDSCIHAPYPPHSHPHPPPQVLSLDGVPHLPQGALSSQGVSLGESRDWIVFTSFPKHETVTQYLGPIGVNFDNRVLSSPFRLNSHRSLSETFQLDLAISKI